MVRTIRHVFIISDTSYRYTVTLPCAAPDHHYPSYQSTNGVVTNSLVRIMFKSLLKGYSFNQHQILLNSPKAISTPNQVRYSNQAAM